MSEKSRKRRRILHIRIPQFKTLNIIGLIVLAGLFISGLVIIRNVNAEFAIRQVAGRFQEFRYATLSFNNIYSGLPGDISNASFYWKDATTDGNGDRKIDHASGEGIAAFKQLQLAELIDLPKELTGKWTEKGEGVLVPYVNIPGVYNDNTGIYMDFSAALGTNVFGLGQADGAKTVLTKPALTPDEAYMLDLMIDDGYPSKGSVIGATDLDNGCFMAGEYKKEDTLKECLLMFRL